MFTTWDAFGRYPPAASPEHSFEEGQLCLNFLPSPQLCRLSFYNSTAIQMQNVQCSLSCDCDINRFGAFVTWMTLLWWRERNYSSNGTLKVEKPLDKIHLALHTETSGVLRNFFSSNESYFSPWRLAPTSMIITQLDMNSTRWSTLYE